MNSRLHHTDKRLRNIVLLLGMFLLLAYRFRRQAFARALRLPAVKYKGGVETGLRLTMRDGIRLATDHYYPIGSGNFPTVLIRSPYGRGRTAGAFGVYLAFVAERFTERGYHVIVQDTRGRFESEGEFNPYFNEKADGLATLDWLKQQDWFNGEVGLWGPSYLGIVQWAIAADAPEVKALVPIVTGSQLQSVVYPDGAVDLGLALRWMALFHALDQKRNRRLVTSAPMLWQVERAITPAFAHLPLAEVDSVALGSPVDFFRIWLEHTDPADKLWTEIPKAINIANVTAPAHFIGGWYDFFLRTLLLDYAALKTAGRNPYLTIGPWHHFNGMVSPTGIREGINWFNVHLKGNHSKLRDKPVRIYVMGAREWRAMDDWPPPYRETCCYLHAGRRLEYTAPADDQPTDHYTYDPANPTPALGGTQFSPWAGRYDNRKLEARPDVLTYTTPPLTHDMEVIGHVRLELYVTSSLEHTDFFGRVCDVYPNGRSINICDGLFRITPGKVNPQPDGSLRLEIDLWATAHHFKAGHRIRLQVSSGAHPRWNRNPGTGEHDGQYTVLKAANQTIYHDVDHPSALVLPVYPE